MAGWFSSRSTHPQLGPLETRLLGMLRQRDSATVRELLDTGALNVAYTTVMTTLHRLYKKGLLDRIPEGRAFRYRMKQTDREYHETLLQANLTNVLASALDPASPVSFLVDAVTEYDAALLEELSRAVNRKRRELRNKEGA